MSAQHPESTFSTLITANHIIHYHNVVDAYGHVSVRNPANPDTFFMSGNLAPALVSSLQDLVEYKVSDASAVNEDAPRGYAERFIHSELYKKYKGVNSVIHSHAEAVIPFGVCSVPLRPVFHMGGVMGAQVPVFDIAPHYTTSDPLHSMLVTNAHLGAALAAGFSPTTMMSKTTSAIKNYLSSTPTSPPSFPPSPTVLMRGHGFTCVGATIEEAVYRSIYTCTNARVQTTALLLQGGFNTGLVGERVGRKQEDRGKVQMEGIRYLDERECRDSWEANMGHAARPWKLWCREVEGTGLYKNEVGKPPGA